MTFWQRVCRLVVGHVIVVDGFLKIDGHAIPIGHCGVCRYKP